MRISEVRMWSVVNNLFDNSLVSSDPLKSVIYISANYVTTTTMLSLSYSCKKDFKWFKYKTL